MLRGIGVVILTVLLWFVLATAIHRLMCVAWPAYAVATPLLAFTLPMKIARLLLSTICTLIAGAIGQRLSRVSWVPLALGCVLILVFLPIHYRLWDRFPAWYHLTFLGSLIPLAMIGAHLFTARRTQTV